MKKAPAEAGDREVHGVMEFFGGWLVLALGIAWWANAWGRSALKWALVAILLSPLLGALGLLIVGRRTRPVAVAPPITGEHWRYPKAEPDALSGEHWQR